MIYQVPPTKFLGVCSSVVPLDKKLDNVQFRKSVSFCHANSHFAKVPDFIYMFNFAKCYFAKLANLIFHFHFAKVPDFNTFS